jgi:steroid delta-isomerase-like uncharacterized protein
MRTMVPCLQGDIWSRAWFFALVIMAAGCSPADPAASLQPLVDRYVHAWNSGDFAGLEEVVAGDFEFRMSPQFEAVRGIDSLKAEIVRWRAAYPDFTITIDELVYAPDAVTVRWTISATNSGPGPSPPTGKRVVVPGMSLLHVDDGKLIDEWVSGNDLAWATQMGLVLRPAENAER